jgi:hypothetical protein
MSKKPQTKEEILKELNKLLEAYTGLEKNDLIKEKTLQMEAEFSSAQAGNLSNIDEDYIALNVGGKLFTTTKSTLRAIPDSKLDKIITGRFPVIKDENDNIFLDRNPDYFQYVLEFLRDGTILYPSQDSFMRKRINHELKHFECVSTQKNTFVLDPAKKSADLTIGEDQLTAWKTSFEANSVVLGDQELTDGVYNWQVEILAKSAFYHQVFGVCPSGVPHANPVGFYFNSFPCVTTQGYGCLFTPTTMPVLTVGDKIEFMFDADTKQFEASCKAKGLNCKTVVTGDKIKPFFLVYGNGDKFKVTFS